jgi:uncharacterized membrane protein
MPAIIGFFLFMAIFNILLRMASKYDEQQKAKRREAAAARRAANKAGKTVDAVLEDIGGAFRRILDL